MFPKHMETVSILQKGRLKKPRTHILDWLGFRDLLARCQTAGRQLLPSGPLVLVPNSVARPQKGRAPDVGDTAYRLHCPQSSLNALTGVPGHGSHAHRGQHGSLHVLRTVWPRGWSPQKTRAVFPHAEGGMGLGLGQPREEVQSGQKAVLHLTCENFSCK